MKRFILLFFVLSLCTLAYFDHKQAVAGDVDILIRKLVEKGVLSSSDAKELVEEIQKESAQEKADVKKVAAETAKEVVKEEKKKGIFDLPKWVSAIKPFGDLRIRHDTQWKEKENLAGVVTQDDNRNRERFRVRFGLKAQTSEDSEVGIRLASGSGFQNTTNQSFDSHGRGKHVFIDLAYAKWSPCKYFTFHGGKHKNHLFTSPLVWDPDVNPEGIAESFNFDINDRFSLFANLGQMVIDEIKSKNSDPWLFSSQLGTNIKLSENINIQLGATYYFFDKMDRIEYDAGDIDDKETFIGYNNGTEQQMVFDSDGRLVNEFGCLEFQAKAKFKEVLPVPFSVFGSYVQNKDADIDDLTTKGVAYADTDPSDLLRYNGDDRDSGWLAGFDLGNKKKKGDMYFKYWYQVLEDYAFPAVFVDSDFHGGGTNNKGHKASIRYMLTNKIYANATGYMTERDDERKDGKFDEDRIQLDVVFKY